MRKSMSKILITGGSGFIGTNLIEYLIADDRNQILNFDKSTPLNIEHTKYWFQGNIMNLKNLQIAFNSFNPDIVIHLAARTDTLSNNLTDYVENIEGSINVFTAVKEHPCVKRFIHTSTQYVYKSKKAPFPKDFKSFQPHTTYGISKMMSEMELHKSNMTCPWIIVRPTNIWGPWHMRYPNELWKIVDQKLYLHPGKTPIIRTYGYVKNVVYQIAQLAFSQDSSIINKTYYLGDLPIDSFDWINEISLQTTGYQVRTIPRNILKIGALVGDVLLFLKIKFPLYSQRYQNMIEDFYAPTNIIIDKFGLSHPSLSENVIETFDWIVGIGSINFPYWLKRKVIKHEAM